jgi:hypothetical protein
MTLAALSSFRLTGLRDGLSVIHLLSVWTLVAMALAIYFRQGQREAPPALHDRHLPWPGRRGDRRARARRMLYRFFFSA